MVRVAQWKRAALAAVVGAGLVVVGVAPAGASPAPGAATEVAGGMRLASATISRVAPTITGTLAVGKKLTANAGSFTPSTATVTYQWSIAGVKVSGATSKTFTPTASHRGKTVSVKVTLAKSGYTTSVKTATRTGAIGYGTITRSTPTISGTVRSGAKLTAGIGTFAPSTATVTYQWYVGGVAVKGATTKYFTPKDVHVNKPVTVKVTMTKSGYTTTSKTSAATRGVSYQVPALSAEEVANSEGWAEVGVDIQPGTYYTDVTEWCSWDRSVGEGFSDEVVGWDVGSGRRMVAIDVNDVWFYTEGCGDWYKYDGTAISSTVIPGDSVSRVGVHMPVGTYQSEGGPDCEIFGWSAPGGWPLGDSTGEYFQWGRAVTEPLSITLTASDTYFESYLCGDWTRVS